MYFLSLPFIFSGKDSLSRDSGNKFAVELKILDGLRAVIYRWCLLPVLESILFEDKHAEKEWRELKDK